LAVHAAKDIVKTIKFIQEEKIKAIFYQVEQGYKVAEEIKKPASPVSSALSMTSRRSRKNGYDSLFLNPVILNKAGVKIAFSSSSSSAAKDLPYQAAKAAAFGLDRLEALKAVTIYRLKYSESIN